MPVRSSVWVGVLVSCVACVTNVQQHLAFGSAPVVPNPVDGVVGELVKFDVRPPVVSGSKWLLECHGRARFSSDPMESAIEWTASPEPIRMETIVSPWDPAPGAAPAAARGWLWYGLVEHGESEALDRELPVRRLPYKEVAPVTFSAAFSTAPRDVPLAVTRSQGRVLITFKTPADRGVPREPSIDAKLLETNGKRILYAEVSTNFGQVPKEPIAYDVTLSYAADVPSPVEVVVVSWVGHGPFLGPFSVDRLNIDDATPAAAATAPASAAKPSG